MRLIDTVVLSELRRRERDPGVVAWIGSQRQEDVGWRAAGDNSRPSSAMTVPIC